MLTVLVVGFFVLMVMMFKAGCRGEEGSSASPPVEVHKQEPLKLKETDAYAEWQAASREDRMRLCEKFATRFRRENLSDMSANLYYLGIETYYQNGNKTHRLKTVAKICALVEH